MKKKVKQNYNKDYIYHIQNKNIGTNELKILFYNVRKTKWYISTKWRILLIIFFTFKKAEKLKVVKNIFKNYFNQYYNFDYDFSIDDDEFDFVYAIKMKTFIFLKV